MNRSWWGKLLLLVFFVGLSIVYVIPTLANLDLEKTKFPFKQKINLGLDLQGGLYLVLGVDFNKVYKDVVDRQASSLKERLQEKNLGVKDVKIVRENFPVDDPRVFVEFDAPKRDEVYNLVKTEFWTLRLAGENPGRLELGLSREYRAEVRDHTMTQSIEVIRNRIDEFGVSEPSIVSQGTDRIVVELPGIREVDRAKDLIGRTAKLEFKMVDDKAMSQEQLAALIAEAEKTGGFTFKEGQKFSEYVGKLNDALKSKIPAGDEIAFERGKTIPGQEASAARIPYLLKAKTEVTGEDLQDAQVQIDQENRRPNVGFNLNPRGASLFDKLTAESVGQRLAIVLDNIVH